MIRNLKVLAIALGATFALSAAFASASFAANGELTSTGPVELFGEEIGVGENRLTAFGGFTECPGTFYIGEKYRTILHEPMPAHTSTVTITPHYVNCVTKEGTSSFPTTVDMEGCDFELHLLETTLTGADLYGVNSTVNCEATHHIKVTLFSGGFRVCTLTVTEKESAYPEDAYAGLKATDTTNGHIDIKGSAEGIKADKSGLCGSGTTEIAKQDLNVNFHGRNEAGTETSIAISHL